jgi:drug/metabolite transporter (DMT)-like permease
MSIPAQYMPAACSLMAMLIWGVSDFSGGVGARRVNAFLFTAVVHASAIILMFSIALLSHTPFPERLSVLWALAAGSVGGISLATFYRALATGKMGLTAPVAAVLGAAIPTIVTAFREGLPGPWKMVGFSLAGIGVWLISREEGAAGRPDGLGMAVLAGVGFALFYLFVHQTGTASPVWISGISRCASFAVTGVFVLATRQLRPLPGSIMALAIFTGMLDITGTALFVRASQTGRLDNAVVLSSLYPAITVLMANVFLREHFSRSKTVGMLAALASVPLVAG